MLSYFNNQSSFILTKSKSNKKMQSDLNLHYARQHRRSISQVIAATERFSTYESSAAFVNLALQCDDLNDLNDSSTISAHFQRAQMSTEAINAQQRNPAAVVDRDIAIENSQQQASPSQQYSSPDFQISTVDSEYDETLGFPDSVTILTSVGDTGRPVLVQRKETDEYEETEEDEYDDDDDDDENEEASGTEISYLSLYGPNVKFNSLQRKVFIPNREIHVRIVDTERNLTTHFLSPNLYTIELTHGCYKWTIRRRYKHFNSLHQSLSFFRTSLNIPFPMRSHTAKRAILKTVANQMLDESQLKDLEAHTSLKNAVVKSSQLAAGSTGLSTQQQKQGKRKKKRKLPRFPNKPEPLVMAENIPFRVKQLEDYLYNLLNISLYRHHFETLNFIEVSSVSFVAGLGIKGKEGMLKKRTGSTRPGQVGCNFFGCFQRNCCVRCNYFCSDVICGKWRNRWFFVKETYFGYIRPTDGSIRAVILFDQGFDVSTGIYQTGMRRGLQILTNNRHIILKCWTRRKCKEWLQYLKQTAQTHARDFTQPNAHMSYAPERGSAYASWFVDGAEYMSAIADCIETAREEIFIADWWLSPEIYMKRPAIDGGDYWRLDRMLQRKAQSGVRIFVLLYKEVEMALGINSYYSKQVLTNLHENIKVIRHPDHAKAGIFLWAHHEKLVVIDQTYAFIGGLDLCYGRWDDSLHRLTDMGSLLLTGSADDDDSAEPEQQNKKEVESEDAAFSARNNVDKNYRSFDDTTTTTTTTTTTSGGGVGGVGAGAGAGLTEGLNGTEKYLLSPAQACNTANALEHAKLNTPEMERKNVLDRIKQNAFKKGKVLVQRFTSIDNNNDEEETETETVAAAAAETQLAVVVVGAAEEAAAPTATPADDDDAAAVATVATPQKFDVYYCDQAKKYWYGKDYSNLILKDWMNLEAPLVDMIDRTTTPRMPWHDVCVCLVGATARDVARHFIQRWNVIKLEKLRENSRFPYLMPKSYTHFKYTSDFILKRQRRVTCQILRSVSAWSCGFIETDLVEQSIHDAYIQTITKAQHYIYIENQFFITMQLCADKTKFGLVRNQIGETLFKRILRAHKERKTFRVFVILPLLPGFEGDVGGSTGNAVRAITHWNYSSISRGRNAILTRLKAAGITRPEDYISFHSLRNHSYLNNNPITELIYVHSKLLISDDRIVICGSANINDRSMIGKRDSEIASIITDEEFEDGRMNGQKYPSGVFAGSLRKFLFKEHLGLLFDRSHSSQNFTEQNIIDPVHDSFWHGVWRRLSTNNTEIYDEVFKCLPTDHVKTFAELRKYQEKPLWKTNHELAIKRLNEIQGFLVNLPLEFLNKEILTPPGASKEGLIPTSVWT